MARRDGPFFPFQQLREEMEKLFTDFFGPQGYAGSAGMSRTFPPLNVWEDGDNLFAEAELPGIKPEDVDVLVVGRELTIKGKRAAGEVPEASYHRRERGTGDFSRVVELPVEVDAEHVQARMSNGVLTITLPKAAAARPKKVQVQV